MKLGDRVLPVTCLRTTTFAGGLVVSAAYDTRQKLDTVTVFQKSRLAFRV